MKRTIAFIGLEFHLPCLLPFLKDMQILLKCYAVLIGLDGTVDYTIGNKEADIG